MNLHVPCAIFAAAVSALALTGCANPNSLAGTQITSPKFSQPREITNPYLPLASLKQDVLQNQKERVERTAKPDIHTTFELNHQTIEALAVEDREFDSRGNLTEATLDYLAQDDEGAVYYLGEDVDAYRDGKIVGHAGAWRLGRDTQTPGVLMPAHPRVGDRFKSEDVPHITWEADEVVSVSERATVPAGTWTNCIKIRERASDGGTEYKLYAPGVGCVKEIEGKDDLPLISHETR